MKNLLIVLCCICVIDKAHGQQVYAEFDVGSNKVENIQAFPAGDSLFLTYTDRDIRKSFWIDAAGQTYPVNLTYDKGAQFSAIEKHNDTTYFYYLKEEEKYLTLFTLKQTPENGTTFSQRQRVYLIHGSLLGIHQEPHKLTLLSYVRKFNRIEILSISRGGSTGFVDLQMPDNFPYFVSSLGLINKRELNTIPKGTAHTKVYKEGNSIVFTIDQDRFEIGKSNTAVIKIDLTTRQITQNILPGPDYDKFTSFYYRGQLFRISTTSNQFKWFVFDVQSGKLLYTKTLNQKRSLREQKVFYRTDKSMEVMHMPLSGMISWMADPAILVERRDSLTDIRIITGSYYNSKGVVLMSNMDPVLLLTGLVVFNVVNQFKDPPGITQYFYLSGNVEKGFNLETVINNPAPSVRQMIDDYEISRTSGAPKNQRKWSSYLAYKSYLELDNGAIGIYQENRKKEKKLILLKFNRS